MPPILNNEPRWLQSPVRIPSASWRPPVRPSPLLSAAAAAALLAAVAGPATAATTPAPAKGIASSSVTLLGVAAGGHTASAGTLELLSDMLGAESVAKILLTPLTADGTTYGQQTVTPENSPLTSPALTTGALAPALNGLIGLTSPVIDASVTNVAGEPKTAAGADSFGGLNVLGLPVALDGALEVGSAVTRAGGAVGEKTVVVEDLALPSVADLLGALGLDLKALPVDVLTELLEELDLVNTAVTTADKALTDATAAIQTQIDAAQAEVDKAAAALAAETAKLAGPQSQLAAAEQDLAAKTAALQPAKNAVAAAQSQLTAANTAAATAQSQLTAAQAAAALGTVGGVVPAPLAAAVTAAQTAVDAANASVTAASSAVTTATNDLAAAQSAVDVAQAAVNALKNTIAAIQTTIDGLQKVLDAAVAALRNLLTGVQPLIDQLLGAIMAVLDGTPLVSFDSLSVVTEAIASSNTSGGQTAKVVGGELVGLEVLGTDVLSNVLGTSSVDLLDLVGGTLADVNGLIAELTGTLSSVLSTVPQFPTLSIPAPQVGLLQKSATTDIVNGFGVASTSVKGLSLTLPSVSIPTALALPGAAELPALDGITQVAGLLTSAPVKVDVATLSSNSRFAPAVVAAPGTGTPTTGTPTGAAPQLPRTGPTQALAVLGLVLMAGAVIARRRRTEDALV
jgi:LPXTG-motif cell wall-anchored protein